MSYPFLPRPRNPVFKGRDDKMLHLCSAEGKLFWCISYLKNVQCIWAKIWI